MINQKELKELLHYDPETGLLHWLIPQGNNRIKAGAVAGSKQTLGYIGIKINRRLYKAHRLAWLYMTGNFPEEYTDHINGIRNDNRWCNLREGTNSQNQFNVGIRKDNKLGIKGVCLHRGKYMTKAQINGKSKYLGYFDTAEEASRAYQTFAKQSHGEFYHD